MGLPLKILLLVPKPTGKLLPSFPHNFHLCTAQDSTIPGGWMGGYIQEIMPLCGSILQAEYPRWSPNQYSDDSCWYPHIIIYQSFPTVSGILSVSIMPLLGLVSSCASFVPPMLYSVLPVCFCRQNHSMGE